MEVRLQAGRPSAAASVNHVTQRIAWTKQTNNEPLMKEFGLQVYFKHPLTQYISSRIRRCQICSVQLRHLNFAMSVSFQPTLRIMWRFGHFHLTHHNYCYYLLFIHYLQLGRHPVAGVITCYISTVYEDFTLKFRYGGLHVKHVVATGNCWEPSQHLL